MDIKEKIMQNKKISITIIVVVALIAIIDVLLSVEVVGAINIEITNFSSGQTGEIDVRYVTENMGEVEFRNNCTTLYYEIKGDKTIEIPANAKIVEVSFGILTTD